MRKPITQNNIEHAVPEGSTREEAIKSCKKTIADLKSVTPTLGGKWQSGMIRYYERILTELESGNGHNS